MAFAQRPIGAPHKELEFINVSKGSGDSLLSCWDPGALSGKTSQAVVSLWPGSFLWSKKQTLSISSSAQQEGNIDFDREVRKITGSVEQALKDEDEIIDTVQQRHSLAFLQFPFLHWQFYFWLLPQERRAREVSKLWRSSVHLAVDFVGCPGPLHHLNNTCVTR